MQALIPIFVLVFMIAVVGLMLTPQTRSDVAAFLKKYLIPAILIATVVVVFLVCFSLSIPPLKVI